MDKNIEDKKEDYFLNKADRDKIENYFYSEKNYEKTKSEVNNFLTKIKKDSIATIYDYWFVYSMLAKVYTKQQRYLLAIENIKKSFKYKVEKSFYFIMVWLLGNVYEEIGEVDEAIKQYEKCLKYYTEIDLNEYALYSKFNIAKLIENSEAIEDIICDYKTMKITEAKYFDKDENLNEMYEALYNIYSKKNDKSKIISLIHKTENRQLKQKFLKGQKILVAI